MSPTRLRLRVESWPPQAYESRIVHHEEKQGVELLREGPAHHEGECRLGQSKQAKLTERREVESVEAAVDHHSKPDCTPAADRTHLSEREAEPHHVASDPTESVNPGGKAEPAQR